jgi:hypothetical protein
MFPARALSGRPRRPRATRQVVVAVQVRPGRGDRAGPVLIVRIAERGVAPKGAPELETRTEGAPELTRTEGAPELARTEGAPDVTPEPAPAEATVAAPAPAETSGQEG